jgi:hypothetical protein
MKLLSDIFGGTMEAPPLENTIEESYRANLGITVDYGNIE